MTIANNQYGWKQAICTPASGTTVTYNGAVGGFRGARTGQKAGTVVKHATATQTRPTINAVVEIDDTLSLTVDDLAVRPVIGTKYSVAVTAIENGGTEKVFTYAGMVYTGLSQTGSRGQAGSVELEFVHESADGSTDPITTGA